MKCNGLYITESIRSVITNKYTENVNICDLKNLTKNKTKPLTEEFSVFLFCKTNVIVKNRGRRKSDNRRNNPVNVTVCLYSYFPLGYFRPSSLSLQTVSPRFEFVKLYYIYRDIVSANAIRPVLNSPVGKKVEMGENKTEENECSNTVF